MAQQPDTEVKTYRMSLTPKTHPPGSHATGPPCAEGHNDSPDKYFETDTCHPLADLLDKFQQLKKQFVRLKSNTPQSTPTRPVAAHR